MVDWQELSKRAAAAFDEGRIDEACNLAEELRRANPDSGMAYQVLGMTHVLNDRPYQAKELLRRALDLNPGLVPARCQLGVAHSMLSEAEEALQCFETAIRLHPDHIASRFNRAQIWLQMGNFRDGWLEYEWRWRGGQVTRPDIPRPSWDGRPVCGRSILVHTEQGIGDTLQFIRLMSMLKKRGARVVFACQTPLHEFLQSIPCVDEWFPIDQEATISFEWCCSLLSLPGLLQINSESDIPANVPYVSADPERVEYWRSKVDALPGSLKVGLNWQGKPSQSRDRLRSIPLEKFAPIAALPDVTLVSLHKGVGESQIESNRAQVPLTVFDEMDAAAPFVDTAAIMMHLDLIISTDTSTIHLAGALGRPVWVPLSTACDWRFLYGRTDSPWYPTMRLFRQKTFNVWEPVIEEITASVHAFRSENSNAAVIRTHRAGDSGLALPCSPISVGELMDKITILEIKAERIKDSTKIANVRRELEFLRKAQQTEVPNQDNLSELVAELRSTNEKLWEIEDELRNCEKKKDFGKHFAQLARAVYKTNDKRADLKKQINELSGSELFEEKSYE